MMPTSARMNDIVTSSASSSHSSDSQTSFSSAAEAPYPSPQVVPPRPTMSGRSASVLHVRMISNPSDYSLPGVTPSTYVLYAIAGARVYHSTRPASNHIGPLSFARGRGSKNNGSQWIYSHLKGTLVFGRDKLSDAETDKTSVEEIVTLNQGEVEPSGEWWFQLVDDESDKVVWKFKLPLTPGSKFIYELDRPFFHVFKGSSRKYGFLFDDDKESATFSNEVTNRTAAATAALRTSIDIIDESMTLTSEPFTAKSSKGRSRSLSIKSNRKSKSKASSSSSPRTGGISAAVVSSPTSFKHVGHIGFNQMSGAVETSKDLDPAFREIMGDLRMQTGSNVTENIVLEHLDFVQGFWKDVGSMQRSMSSRPVPAN
ncbi:hypothetical protein NP233_g12627 [Leucocoprinus birnbaumii]|uniref:CRIB domain-containing protein n=1 Tax=Leucocoprinus birnbaumii TaxID=56174 RepID=A0AAD5YMW5_9AGAR|nr:hypothetical protein NP233_g12627 [Leucocoprinus birnbaumii]